VRLLAPNDGWSTRMVDQDGRLDWLRVEAVTGADRRLGGELVLDVGRENLRALVVHIGFLLWPPVELRR
jgi:hypothetical protein